MIITRRQLRRIIREAIEGPDGVWYDDYGNRLQPDDPDVSGSNKIPSTKISVEWDLGDNPDPGLPPEVDLPPDVVAEYEEYMVEYGDDEAAQAISDWLDDEYGFLSQWNFV